MVPSSRDGQHRRALGVRCPPVQEGTDAGDGAQRAKISSLQGFPEVLTLAISWVFRCSVPRSGTHRSHRALGEKALRAPRCLEVAAFGGRAL